MIKHIWVVMMFISIANAMNGQTVNQESNQLDNQAAAERQLIYCPRVETLAKDPVMGKWSTQGGWYSQEYSFVAKLDAFDGAIYQGEDMGRIICQYSASETGDRLIMLKNTMLVQLPESTNGGGQSPYKWQKSNQRNTMICMSSRLEDCPFLLYHEETQGRDINQTILMLPQN